MPIIGWNFWFTENIFLARNAQRDIKKIQDGIDELVNSKKPFWMTLYVMDRNNTFQPKIKNFPLDSLILVMFWSFESRRISLYESKARSIWRNCQE